MGLQGLSKRPAALSVSDAALAQQIATLVGAEFREALREDRELRGYLIQTGPASGHLTPNPRTP